jgi:ring-1,2-phenylacetyl-CoA epoxidase subunit PaaE
VPRGGHVVDAALAQGIRVPYSCKGGMCCTCRAKVIEGQAQMTTNYSLEPWEIARGFILTCQAVPTSDRLVVDYDQM